MKRIYLDYNATTPCESWREVLSANMPLNPSSLHWHGREARKILQIAREKIYQAFSIDPRKYSLTFTSSGTEANNLAVNSFKSVFASSVEHPSIIRVPHVELITVNQHGLIDLNALRAIAPRIKGSLVCIMLANNETGAIQPIDQAARLIKEYGGFLHSDCVQALGKLEFNIAAADSFSISGHKIGTFPGIGALIHKNTLPIKPLIFGGGQELGLRGGTENVLYADIFARAIEGIPKMVKEYNSKVSGLRQHMEHLIRSYLPSVKIWSEEVDRLPNTSCILMPWVKAQIQTIGFDLAGFSVSAGSACSSGKMEESHVLKAMGLSSQEASCSIRVSLGPKNTQEEVNSFVKAWQEMHQKLGQTRGHV